MTPAGWIFLVVSLTFVWGLAIWCFRKVLTAPPDVEEEIAKDLEPFHSA
jgi:hypothetical protein